MVKTWVNLTNPQVEGQSAQMVGNPLSPDSQVTAPLSGRQEVASGDPQGEFCKSAIHWPSCLVPRSQRIETPIGFGELLRGKVAPETLRLEQ